MTASIWTAFVRSDVYAGSSDNEDGESNDELSFYVVLENDFGTRYASKTTFTTEEFGHNHNGVANAKAEDFCKTVEKALLKGANPVTSAKWSMTFPRYASPAYGRGGMELEAEARDLEVEAGPQEADRFRAQVGL